MTLTIKASTESDGALKVIIDAESASKNQILLAAAMGVAKILYETGKGDFNLMQSDKKSFSQALTASINTVYRHEKETADEK